FLVLNSQSTYAQFTEDFSGVSCSNCMSFSFTQGGVQYNVTSNTNMNISGNVEQDTTSGLETSIVRADGGEFTFTSIYLLVIDFGTNDVTVGGYNNGSLVGGSQIVAKSTSATLNFSIGAVDEVKLTGNNVLFQFDNFSGSNAPPNTAPVFENSKPATTSITTT